MNYLPGQEGDPPSQLVKSFSDDLQRTGPGDTLQHGLAVQVAVDRQQEENIAILRDKWNFFLLEGRDLAQRLIPDEEAILLDQSRKLHQAWKKFCECLPGQQSTEALSEKPSLRLLYESVSIASETWNDKRETIAQASINHQALAEGVSTSLKDLSEDMAYWNKLISECSNVALLERHIRELYIVVFELLTEIFTQWSKSLWRRFLASFDEQAFQKLFNQKQDRIKAIEKRMKRDAKLDFESTTRRLLADLKRTQRLMGQEFQVVVDSQSGHSQLLRHLGSSIIHLLAQKTGGPFYDAANPPSPEHSTSLGMLSTNRLLAQGSATITPPDKPLPNQPEDRAVDLTPKDNTGPAYNQPLLKNDILKLLDQIQTKYGKDIQRIVDITLQASHVSVDHQVKRRIDA
ncbi:hypothetical protein F5Y14DRAFT_457659 [Nemania sp. NC0429]|nr:hypothetical protein F5Y14DRAFT_457659 [Nemania sp. NC0429]